MATEEGAMVLVVEVEVEVEVETATAVVPLIGIVTGIVTEIVTGIAPARVDPGCGFFIYRA